MLLHRFLVFGDKREIFDTSALGDLVDRFNFASDSKHFLEVFVVPPLT